jgi:hypothetical protein
MAGRERGEVGSAGQVRRRRERRRHGDARWWYGRRREKGGSMGREREAEEEKRVIFGFVFFFGCIKFVLMGGVYLVFVGDLICFFRPIGWIDLSWGGKKNNYGFIN